MEQKVKTFIEYPEGATPLDPDEMKALLPDYISTQGELNTLEQENILSANGWARKKRQDLLNEAFLRELHHKMFGNVWKWAGQFRKTAKNIGAPAERVPEELHKLLADTRYWIENNTYPWPELGARFHHRLILIHPFPNGNGRHARLLTDLLLEQNGQPPFTWGQTQIEQKAASAQQVRESYIAALREADAKRLAPLLAFVIS